MFAVKHVITALVAVLPLLSSLPASAQLAKPLSNLAEHGDDQDSLLVQLIVKDSYPLALTDQQFSGPGWIKLMADVKASQFVLIGEDHGFTQIPVLTAAIAELFKPKLYAAEIDPYTAQALTDLLKKPGLPVAHQRRYFQGLSFYSWAEEYQLLQALRAQQAQLVGLEQISYGFAGQLFTLMAEKAKSATTKTYLQQQAQTYQTNFDSCMRQRTYLRPSESSIDSLLTMTKDENPELRKMADDFVASFQIYEASQLRTGGHQKRVNFMKHNLLETLKPYLTTGDQSLPTMLFKFGANHMARNLSIWSGVFDVGNLVVNLADTQNKKSLHIMIMGKQGTRAGYTDIDDVGKDVRVSYSAVDYPFLKPFFDQTTTQWQVFDLRSTRRAIINDKLQVASQELEATVLGYDYLIVIPETTGSRAF